MNMIFPHSWASSNERLAIALAITVVFAGLAHAVRGVDRSGMLAGGIACFLLFACAGPAPFALLALLFALTWAATRLGHGRKKELGLAERGEGRNATQAFANLAVAAAGAAVYAATANRTWLLIVSAALAEAATDTVASEVGQSRSQTALMITTWKQVPAGTDGGITLHGTLAGTLAGLLIACAGVTGGLFPLPQLWIPVTAGFAGMVVDSLLGATAQRRGWVSNEMVNLLGTLVAALVAGYCT